MRVNFGSFFNVWDRLCGTYDSGLVIRPLTPIGRASERLLKLNISERVEIRETLAKVSFLRARASL